jgi:O-antigen/teichoic acid export membrane protein
VTQDQGFESLPTAEVRRRASAGLFFVGATNTVLLVAGFLGNLVLARLLTPEDFGIIAFGLTAILLANAFSDGGLVAGLVRRETSPEPWELRSLMGVQLVASVAIVLLGAAVAAPFGEPGYVVIVMLISLPVASIQAPGRIVLTRRMLFSRISVIDLASMLVFYTWAIAWAVAGAGVWAMATGVVCRSLASSCLFVAISGLGRIRPSLARLKELAPTIRFGIVFQFSWIAQVTIMQIANFAAGLLLGVGPLGIYSLATRLMQLPLVLFQSVWHVSFPAMSHVMGSGRDAGPVVERVLRVAAVLSVLVLSPFAACAPGLVPALFGPSWSDAGYLVALGCAAMLVIGPVSAASTGTLYAAGDARSVLRATLVAGTIALLSAIGLMPFIGVYAMGVGSVVRAGLEASILARAIGDSCGARVTPQVRSPIVIGMLSGGAGVAVDVGMGSTLAGGLAGPLVALITAAVGLLLLRRDDLVAAMGIAREAVSSARMRLA